ncbi:MAG: hypothetical protein V2I40_16855 [Desulfobacteraceae bacterium]|jgi:hypothetical protein|nr:hypothetical protein [Desulfobacteraceae bacterium]
MVQSPTDQCIVLPFRAETRHPFDGTGLALHFLVGNVLALHTGLKEMWFGWRVKKIFPEAAAFQRYCRDAADKLDLLQASRSQQVRLWLYGNFSGPSVSLHFFDGLTPDARQVPVDLPISIDDGLIGFRTPLLEWLEFMGRPMPTAQVQAALWPETTGREGLDAVGRALEGFYLYSAYGGEGPLDPLPFKTAVAKAPESFMAHDLYGWARYRNKDYPAAKRSFLTALRINPAGTGAMSGLMWCGVYGKDLEEAMFWSGRKADICRQDVQAAREAGRRRYEKVNP